MTAVNAGFSCTAAGEQQHTCIKFGRAVEVVLSAVVPLFGDIARQIGLQLKLSYVVLWLKAAVLPAGSAGDCVDRSSCHY